MTVQRIANVLIAFSGLVADCGDVAGSADVKAMASALAAAGEAKVPTTVAKIQKYWGSISRQPSYPRRLSALLAHLDAVLSDSSASAVRKDLSSLRALLAGQRDASGDDFARDVRLAILAPLPPRKTKQSARPPLGDAEVRCHADRLAKCSTEQNAFEAELRAIQEIPKLKVDELRRIAERFLGYEPPATKAAILKKLRTRQKQDAIDASRDRRIQKIAV